MRHFREPMVFSKLGGFLSFCYFTDGTLFWAESNPEDLQYRQMNVLNGKKRQPNARRCMIICDNIDSSMSSDVSVWCSCITLSLLYFGKTPRRVWTLTTCRIPPSAELARQWTTSRMQTHLTLAWCWSYVYLGLLVTLRSSLAVSHTLTVLSSTKNMWSGDTAIPVIASKCEHKVARREASVRFVPSRDDKVWRAVLRRRIN